jgi:hypothetical protein
MPLALNATPTPALLAVSCMPALPRAQCTLAKLIGPASAHPAVLALYCTVGPALLALLTINRAATWPPMLWASGMVTLLVFGNVVIAGGW